MKIDVQYLQKRGKNGWRYRRKVPKTTQAVFGKGEIVIPLGRTEQEALRRYPKAHAEAEQLLRHAQLGKRLPPDPNITTPLDLYREAVERVQALGLNPQWQGWEHEDDPEGIARDVIAGEIAGKYPVDDEGNPTGISPKDSALLRVLLNGAREKKPQPTLEDAKRIYLSDRIGDDNKKKLELERVFRLMSDIIPSDRPLSELTRAEAREVRDHMLDGRKAASVERYLNVVRAMLNHALVEYELKTVSNPFMKLPVKLKGKVEPNRDKRKPFSETQLAVTRDRVLGYARDDLKLIWRLLEATGCRISEVTGLRKEDVNLIHAIPHISVEWHENRRIKTEASHRKVPLIGDALDAAKEALKTSPGPMLFPAYGVEGGGNRASAALGKHVRACIADPKIVTHSLRHRMKDLTRRAGVSKADQDILLGHSSGSVGEDYGGDEGCLEAAMRALEAAYRTAEELKRQEKLHAKTA